MSICVRFALGWGLLLPVMAATPSVSPRVALVVGNAKYETAVGSLRNAVNDAKSVAKTLRGLGFVVIEEHNVTRNELIDSVARFRPKLRGAEVALFYYAGHGIAVGGSNYLIPVKSGYNPDGADETALKMLAETKLFNAEQVVAEMSAAGGRCNLVILDACRTTPVARDLRNRGITTAGGLAEMKPPAGSLIAFATDAGRTARDGDGSNGLYTEALLRHLRTPGLTIEQVFKRTRAEVMQRSEGTQIPAEYSRLVGDDIYLAGSAPQVSKAERVELPTTASIRKLAAAGHAVQCLESIELAMAGHGEGDYAVALSDLLDRVKEDLKRDDTTVAQVEEAKKTCDGVLRVVTAGGVSEPERKSPLLAKAHNRRGDCLFRLGRAEEALVAYHAAMELEPNDAYPLYNRGRVHLALGRKEEARADFMAVMSEKFHQPSARKLAEAELKKLDDPPPTP